MMRNFIFIYFFTSSFVLTYCQSDFYNYKFTYLVKEQIDKKENPTILEENMVLYVGKQKSLYISPTKVKVDSVRIAIKKNQGSFYELSEYKSTLPKNKILTYIEKSNLEKIIRIFHVMPNLNPYYEENFPKLEWKISSEKRKILNYTCQKATLHFKGRNYTAWFSLEISLQNGPWKFGGLPGLIFEISDTRNEYSFRLIGIKKETRAFPNSGIKPQKTTKEGVSVVLDNYLKNMESKMTGDSKEAFRKKRLALKNSNKVTNPIELEN